jgi:uncharacterized protein (DUF58 family)
VIADVSTLSLDDDDDALLDSGFLKKLEYLRILSKQAFAGRFRAERRSRALGAGLEFADHRMYAAGDDIRRVDWRAWQRLGRLLVRLFEEEQDLPIYLFIDASRSMAAGRPSKLSYARRVAAALCYIGLAKLDRVSLIAYSARLREQLPTQRGKGRIFRIFSFLSAVKPEGETDAVAAFTSFCTSPRRRGLAVVISDLLDPHGFAGGLDVLRRQQNDLFVIHLSSPTDAAPDWAGDLRLVDAETGEACDVSVTPAMLEAYRGVYARFCTEVDDYCTKYGAGYVKVITDAPFEDVILQVFRQGRFIA